MERISESIIARSKMRACIFDLDGTILYTLESIALAGNRMLEQLGFPPQPVEDYRYYCGDGASVLVKRVLTKVGGLTEENLKSGDLLNRAFLAEKPLYHVKPYDGIPEALASLKERGILLAVCSNKPHEAAQQVIPGMFGDLFAHVQGQTPTIPTKPDPQIALRTAEELGVKPEECVYFGDTWTDMQTGRAAGMRTVGVLWGYRDRKELTDNGAEILIERPEEIPLTLDL